MTKSNYGAEIPSTVNQTCGFRHIEEDLTGMHVHHKDVNEMTEDEKSFYYFKIHDTDNNDNLDGLEMIKAAIHRHENFELADELTHVTNVVDEFLDFADLNRDGFLNYAEYVKAMNSTNESNEANQPLTSTHLHNGIEN
jgi:multiple coagulation factor deficiency protein 2